VISELQVAADTIAHDLQLLAFVGGETPELTELPSLLIGDEVGKALGNDLARAIKG
jgi:hypothetical protein